MLCIFSSRLRLYIKVSTDALSHFSVSFLDHYYRDCCVNKYTSPGNSPECNIPGDQAPVFIMFKK